MSSSVVWIVFCLNAAMTTQTQGVKKPKKPSRSFAVLVSPRDTVFFFSFKFLFIKKKRRRKRKSSKCLKTDEVKDWHGLFYFTVCMLGAVYGGRLEPWTVGERSSSNRQRTRELQTLTDRLTERPPFDWQMLSLGMGDRRSANKPKDWETMSARQRKVVTTQQWRERLKQNPQLYRAYRQKQLQYVRKYRAKRKNQFLGCDSGGREEK